MDLSEPDPSAHKTPLERAKDAIGGPTALAHAISGDITPQAVVQWKQVPVLRVLEVERVTGIPRHELRPDIYPVPEGTAA